MNSKEIATLKDMAREYHTLPYSFRDIFAGRIDSRLDRHEYLRQSLPPLPGEPCTEIMDE
jgi:hypothetical protein